MSNILDLFRDDLSKVNFDISGTRCMYEKIKRMQQSVGGTPHITAKVGTGGVNMFILSNGNKGVTVEKFSGVIIGNHKCNAWFPKGELNSSPICSSNDGIIGINRQTGEYLNCMTCPNNEFGSDGNGKLCKNMHKLYILAENCAVPITLSLPPTSLENWRNYVLSGVAVAEKEISEVVTEFSLSGETSQTGNKYSVLNFKMTGYVNDDVNKFCSGMSELIQTYPQNVLPEDYNREPQTIEQAQDFDSSEVKEKINNIAAEEIESKVIEPEIEEIDIETL